MSLWNGLWDRFFPAVDQVANPEGPPRDFLTPETQAIIASTLEGTTTPDIKESGLPAPVQEALEFVQQQEQRITSANAAFAADFCRAYKQAIIAASVSWTRHNDADQVSADVDEVIRQVLYRASTHVDSYAIPRQELNRVEAGFRDLIDQLKKERRDLGLRRVGDECQDRRVDVVFVHGLNGHRIDTWERDNCFWPALIASELPTAAVFTFGYDAHISNWNGPSMALKNRAPRVAWELEQNGIGDRPVVFVAHSLGGLLVKRLLRHSRDSEYCEPRIAQIFQNVKGIAFLGTPHFGARPAKWLTYLDFFGIRSSDSIGDLQPDSEELNELNDWFVRTLPLRGDVQIQVFRETRGVGKPGRGSLQVVDGESADPGINSVQPIDLDADHIQMCKVSRLEDPLCASIIKLVRGCL